MVWYRKIPWALACVAVLALALREIPPRIPADPMEGWYWDLDIDGKNYVVSALRMIQQGSWIDTENTRHSVGMQILTAALFRALEEINPYAVRLWNFGAWFLLLAVFAGTLWRFLGPPWAFVGAWLLYDSAVLAAYRFHVQYEMTAAALCFAVALLQCPPSPRKALLSGVLLACLSIFRVHFLTLFFLVAANALRPRFREGRHAVLAALAAGFLVLAVPFNGYFSRTRGEPFFFQSNIRARTFVEANSARSTGALYPYTATSRPRGLAFVLKDPLGYLNLLEKRARFLFGAQAHVWFVESRWTLRLAEALNVPPPQARVYFVPLACLLAVAGIALTWRRHPHALAFLLPLLTVLLPNFFINSASRLLVPALPCILWFQVVALRELALFLDLTRPPRRMKGTSRDTSPAIRPAHPHLPAPEPAGPVP